jgi:esterase/lipase
MEEHLIDDGKYRYIEKGEGTPMIILHGLMGGLSNFQGVSEYFPSMGYKVLIPELPIYDMPLLKTTVKNFATFLEGFIEHKGLKLSLIHI